MWKLLEEKRVKKRSGYQSIVKCEKESIVKCEKEFGLLECSQYFSLCSNFKSSRTDMYDDIY